MVRIRGPVFAVLSGLLASAAACSTAATTSAATTSNGSTTVPAVTATTEVKPPVLALPSRVFGVSIANFTQLGVVASLRQHLDRHVDVVDFYTDWGAPFPKGPLNRIVATGAIPEVTWEPWIFQLGVHQNSFPLSSITAGKFDSYIEGWAKAAKAWGGTLLVRFAHEMNGYWYPWCVGQNGNTAADYVAAYRHVFGLMSDVRNLRWIWSPNVLLPGQTAKTLAALYPGNAYVNYVGIDGYNFGTSSAKLRWLTPDQVFAATVNAVKAITRTEPILFAEVASTTQGGNKAQWINQLFQFLRGQPRIVGFMWTEFKTKGDWPVESSTASLSAMRIGLAGWDKPRAS